MMRYLLLFIFLVLNESSQACKCSWIPIEDAYKRADVVFYGIHLGTIETPNVFNIHNQPSKFEQFGVKRFYKGGSDAFSIDKEEFIISIRSTCNQSCGNCYDSGSYYLVYAQVMNSNLQLQTDLCSRSRIILNNQFMVPSSKDPDAGKDEARELTKLSRNDTLNHINTWSSLKEMEEARWADLQKQLKKKNSMTIILSTTTLILLIYVLLDWFKKKKQTN